jgi:mycobactin lysine-N-oxygenase
MSKRLAVIGAGPKAAALAVKARVLRDLGVKDVTLVLFDPDGPGAAWDGRHGYTDGEQSLCTPAERDLGFPYDRATYGAAVAEEMQARFSWNRYCVAAGGGFYADWVARGQPKPRHASFAAYIAWAIGASGVTLRPSTVEAIAPQPSGGWQVMDLDQDGNRTIDLFDGVVVTGSGRPQRPFLANDRVFNGKSFWSHRSDFLDRLNAAPDPSIAIIGAGGTAAAAASWLVSAGFKHVPITIIGAQPTLYARTANFSEDRLFADQGAWHGLTAQGRLDFIQRLGQGAVWTSVLDSIGAARNIEYVSAIVVGLRQTATPVPITEPAAVEALLAPTPAPLPRGSPRPPPPAPTILRDASVFIDARGFDGWGFVDLLPPAVQPLFANRVAIEDSIDPTLAVGAPFPHGGLHLPMHGWLQGPGAPNLMALGWMADCILQPY